MTKKRALVLTVRDVSQNDLASLKLVLDGRHTLPPNYVQRGIARKLVRECTRLLRQEWRLEDIERDRRSGRKRASSVQMSKSTDSRRRAR
jgi:hypothetical protein